ncbi:MAG: hypothetical protein QM809_16160 [Gordonia sp. (in: high G+C Gram-positive bacteria)]|uniref:hypothetical protein n=1 Tax=Gordonia sp. (in: high G+C Gram-positive bacteria) TaxID=84139 RepID=UPI0039E459E8
MTSGQQRPPIWQWKQRSEWWNSKEAARKARWQEERDREDQWVAGVDLSLNDFERVPFRKASVFRRLLKV